MAEQFQTGPAASKSDGAVITIKKYANRRLYNTATSSYVTLDTLAEMVKRGEDFVVFDAKSGDDITRSVLTQIIFEEEAKGENLLPINFLRQLIGFYGNSMQNFVPGYLEMSLEALAKNQSEFTRAFGGEAAVEAMQALTRRNMTLYEDAMQMFTPFGRGLGSTAPEREAAPAPKEPAPAAQSAEPEGEIKALREQMEQMQRALEAMAKKP